MVIYAAIPQSHLLDSLGMGLFRKLRASEHSLHHLLPPFAKYGTVIYGIAATPMNFRSIILQ